MFKKIFKKVSDILSDILSLKGEDVEDDVDKPDKLIKG